MHRWVGEERNKKKKKSNAGVGIVTISHVAPISHLAGVGCWEEEEEEEGGDDSLHDPRHSRGGGGIKGMTYYTEDPAGLSSACRASKVKICIETALPRGSDTGGKHT